MTSAFFGSVSRIFRYKVTAVGYSLRAIMISPRISNTSRGDIAGDAAVWDKTLLDELPSTSRLIWALIEIGDCCALLGTASVKASDTARRVSRLITLLLPRFAYGCGCCFGGSAGFLLDPKIPKTLSRSPFFFLASASALGSVASPFAGGFAAVFPGGLGCTPPGGGGFVGPPFPKRCPSHVPGAAP